MPFKQMRYVRCSFFLAYLLYRGDLCVLSGSVETLINVSCRGFDTGYGRHCDLFSQDERVQIYRPGNCDEHGRCVMYWMQRSQRGQQNQALNAAIALANTLRLPIVVLFVVADYPAANVRHYTFMLQGITVVARMLQERGTPFVIRHGEPATEVLQLARELAAAAVISDGAELRVPRAWRREVQEGLTVPFACVDADVVVPSKFFPKEEWAARTLRPIHATQSPL